MPYKKLPERVKKAAIEILTGLSGAGKSTHAKRSGKDYDLVVGADLGGVVGGKFRKVPKSQKGKVTKKKMDLINSAHKEGKGVLVEGTPDSLIENLPGIVGRADRVTVIDTPFSERLKRIAKRSEKRGSPVISDVKDAVAREGKSRRMLKTITDKVESVKVVSHKKLEKRAAIKKVDSKALSEFRRAIARYRKSKNPATSVKANRVQNLADTYGRSIDHVERLSMRSKIADPKDVPKLTASIVTADHKRRKTHNAFIKSVKHFIENSAVDPRKNPLTPLHSAPRNILEEVGVHMAKKAALKKMAKEKDVSAIKDFLAGVDPTGTRTFEYAGKKRSKKKHSARRAIGVAGGFVGGATVIPSAISGVVGGMKGVAGGGSIKKRLANAFMGALRGAKQPISDVATGIKVTRGLKRKPGETLKKYKVWLSKKTPVSTASEYLAQASKGSSPETAIKKYVAKVKGREFGVEMAKARAPAKEALGEGLAILGLGGAVGGGSAYYQYGKGKKTGDKIRRIKASKITSDGETIKKRAMDKVAKLKDEIKAVLESDERVPTPALNTLAALLGLGGGAVIGARASRGLPLLAKIPTEVATTVGGGISGLTGLRMIQNRKRVAEATREYKKMKKKAMDKEARKGLIKNILTNLTGKKVKRVEAVKEKLWNRMGKAQSVGDSVSASESLDRLQKVVDMGRKAKDARNVSRAVAIGAGAASTAGVAIAAQKKTAALKDFLEKAALEPATLKSYARRVGDQFGHLRVPVPEIIESTIKTKGARAGAEHARGMRRMLKFKGIEPRAIRSVPKPTPKPVSAGKSTILKKIRPALKRVLIKR